MQTGGSRCASFVADYPLFSGADLAVLFMHYEGYSTICGHAHIALGRWAVDCAVFDGGAARTRPLESPTSHELVAKSCAASFPDWIGRTRSSRVAR